MKRIFAGMLLCALVFSCVAGLAGCGSALWDQEEEKYAEKLEAFIAALDASDADGLRNLFSPAVRKADGDLDQQIEKLFSIYPKGTTQHHWDGMTQGDYSQENGLCTAEAASVFPVVAAGEYFWIFLSYVYVDEECADNVGIKQVAVYTADEYCAYFAKADFSIERELGLSVHAEIQLESQIRCIDGIPYAFTPTQQAANLREAEQYICANTDWNGFLEKFGQPNAVDAPYWFFYEVEPQDGERQYLEICAEDGKIIYAVLLGEFSHIRTILEEKTE